MSAVTERGSALWRWDSDEPLSWPLPPGPEDGWFTPGSSTSGAVGESRGERDDRID